MDKLIMKLAYDADLTTYSREGLGGGGDCDNREEIEAFASALLQECFKLINGYIQHNNPNDCLLVLDLKEKFGLD